MFIKQQLPAKRLVFFVCSPPSQTTTVFAPWGHWCPCPPWSFPYPAYGPWPHPSPPDFSPCPSDAVGPQSPAPHGPAWPLAPLSQVHPWADVPGCPQGGVNAQSCLSPWLGWWDQPCLSQGGPHGPHGAPGSCCALKHSSAFVPFGGAKEGWRSQDPMADHLAPKMWILKSFCNTGINHYSILDTTSY